MNNRIKLACLGIAIFLMFPTTGSLKEINLQPCKPCEAIYGYVSPQDINDEIRMMGKRLRRDALHFAIFYSEFPEWSNDNVVVTPKDGYFMDPNAFYRLEPPYDSQSMKKLPKKEKKVPVPYRKADGTTVPADTKRIWPYICE